MAHEKVRQWEKFEESVNGWHPFKWAWQRVTRGYDDYEIANLNHSLTAFIRQRLAHFVEWQLEHGKSCPSDLDPASWLEVLNKMNKAFELLSDSYFGYPPQNAMEEDFPIMRVLTDEEKAIVKEGTELFGKYLTDLRDI